MTRRFMVISALLLAVGVPLLTGAGEKAGGKKEGETVKTESGLEYVDLVVGTGREAKPGNIATVNYTGWLLDGKKFDSSVGKEAFSFRVGGGEVIKGWDEGVAGMKVGGNRRLIIPSHLGYGPRGAGGVIPPNATLIFEVELLEVR